ncbi:MAG TPA: PA14 domain-containing protein, partial [Ohtaekwangia sp.]|uniref:PA14 domain-containing protein n=1 Tax=Ohtaekwangia sp. TaxID=2066019 RepID=UPI002F91D05A
ILAQNKKNIFVFGGVTELCLNGSIKLGFSDGFLAYQWTYNGADIPGATTRFYTLNQTGIYTVKFQRRNGKWAESYQLKITPKTSSTYSPALTNSSGTRFLPIDFNGAKNDTMKLVAPEGFPQYYWYKNGTPFDTTTTNTKVAYFLNSSGTAGTTNEAGVYAVKVKENSGCESLLSSPVTVYYLSPHVGPTAPTVATNAITTISETSVKIAWTDNSTNEEYFEIWRNRNNANGYTSEPYKLVATVPANSTSYTDKGLRPMAKYFYRVRVVGNGDGKFGTERSVTLPNDLIKPSAPANLVVTNITDTQISISWDASTDNDQVAKYEVYESSNLVSSTVTGTTYTFSNLAPNTTYFINVRAVDARGNFSDFAGEALQVTTLTPQNGLTYSYYEPLTVPASFTLATYFSTTQTPVKQGIVSNFDITPRNRNIKFVFAFDGYIQIDVTGNYIFYTKSDDGSRLYIDGVLQVDNDGTKSAATEKSKTVNITTTGKHSIRVVYFYANSVVAPTLTVSYDPPGTPAKQTIPNAKLFRTGATPISYYSKATGNLQDLSTWGTNTNGTGTAPPNFTNGFEYFYIRNRTGNVDLNAAWTVSGTGSKVVVEASGITLNVNAALTGRLEANDNTTINLNNATIPTFGILAATSTVNFNVAGAVPNGSYGNLNLNTASTTKTLPLSSVSVKGNLSVADQVAVQGSEPNKSVLAVNGNLTFQGAESPTTNQLYSIIFKGTKSHTLTIPSNQDVSLYQLTVDFGDALTISNGTSNPVTINAGNAAGGGLILETGALLQLGNNNLSLVGDVSINPNGEAGTIAMNGGNLTLNTTSPLSSNIIFSDTYNSISNLTLSTSSTGKFNLLSSVKATDLVTISKGELNTYNGNLTLVSNASGTARIGPLLSGAKITGDIVFQRYMDGEGRIYRYIASPIKGMKVADIQKYIPVTGKFTGRSTGTGINSTAASMFDYNEPGGGWLNFPANNSTNQDTLKIGKGYSLFIREGTNPTTWEMTGPAYQGTFVFTLTGGTLGQDNGWNLLGNPYPAPIQWTGNNTGGKWSTFQNVSSIVSVRENFGTEYRWRVWNGTTGNLENGIIAPGQSFWVQATSAAPALTITENAKFTTDGSFYRQASSASQAIEITMTNGTLDDQAYIQSVASGSNAYAKGEDAVKQANTYFNLSSKSTDGVALAINVISNEFCQRSIPLSIDNAAVGNYTLKFKGIDGGVGSVYLQDAFLGTQVELTEGFTYSFAITSDVLSKGSRFTIIIGKPAVEAAKTITANSVCDTDPIVTIANPQTDIVYQAFVNGVAVSDQVLAAGSDLQLTLHRDKMRSGTTPVEIKAGYGYEGCDVVSLTSIVNVTIDSLAKPSISVMGNKFYTVAKDTYQYQWFVDGVPVDGETRSYIYPATAGKYTVQVSSGSCAQMSNGVIFRVTATESSALRTSAVSAYPNPFTDVVTVNLLNSDRAQLISVMNVVGETVLEKTATASEENVTLDLGTLPQGTYVIAVGAVRLKVIKKS